MTPGELILWALAIAGAVILACIAVLVLVATVQQLRRRQVPNQATSSWRRRNQEAPRG